MGIDQKHVRGLSRCVSHALRHEPSVYDLQLDEEGWVSIDELVKGLRAVGGQFRTIGAADLREMVLRSSKRRHEMRDGRIRAIYGHSVPQKLIHAVASPPDILFHGTSPASLPRIKVDGLRPMNRQYVHLSIDKTAAVEVGRRKATCPVLLRVRSMEACRSGVQFYMASDEVWLADAVPPEHIEF